MTPVVCCSGLRRTFCRQGRLDGNFFRLLPLSPGPTPARGEGEASEEGKTPTGVRTKSNNEDE
jgi:hypothetical protein